MIDTSGKVDRKLPFGQYEYVDVVFGPANTDLIIPYTRLRPDNVEDVRWIDVTPGAFVLDGDEGPITILIQIYRPVFNDRTAFGVGYIVLRASYADYQTRLLLFVERNEASNV